MSNLLIVIPRVPRGLLTAPADLGFKFGFLRSASFRPPPNRRSVLQCLLVMFVLSSRNVLSRPPASICQLGENPCAFEAFFWNLEGSSPIIVRINGVSPAFITHSLVQARSQYPSLGTCSSKTPRPFGLQSTHIAQGFIQSPKNENPDSSAPQLMLHRSWSVCSPVVRRTPRTSLGCAYRGTREDKPGHRASRRHGFPTGALADIYSA